MLLEVKDGDLFCLPCNKEHNISFLWRKDIVVVKGVDTLGKVSGLVNE